MHSRIARYSFTGDAEQIARKAEEGMLPIFREQPGFLAYTIIKAGDEIVTVSAWETAEAAQAADALSRNWNSQNLADKVELKDARIGEILVSTALGASTKAGATA
jgi:heme-degrading monooxygenase HmoA